MRALLLLPLTEIRAKRVTTLFALVGVGVTITLFFLGLTAKPAHAATFTVTNTNDSGAGSLRKAIEDANATTAADTINFNIPSGGLQTISPTTVLPPITEPVIINGYSQPESSPNTLPTGSNLVLEVELSGASAGASADGLTISAPNVVVKGLLIDGWSSDGIEVKGSSTTNTRIEGNFIEGNGGSGVYVLDTPSTVIGGTSAAARNVISANLYGVTAQASNTRIEGNLIGTDPSGTQDLGNRQYGVWLFFAHDAVIGGTLAGDRNVISGNGTSAAGGIGIFIQGSEATNNKIEGNYIGTDNNGTAPLPNSADGVLIDGAPSNVVGGTTAGAGNVISGSIVGVGVLGGGATNNRLQGNYIGTDKNGTAPLPNFGAGVSIAGAPGNVVGGTSAGARNVISGNSGYGVDIGYLGATNNRLEGNYIGTDKSGTAPLPNSGSGVHITEASSNVVGGTSAGAGNVISGNNGNGVSVFEASQPATGNRILRNSIFANGGLGINLGPSGVTLNDPGDGDTGANNLQNFPDISSAKPTKKKKRKLTTITGTLNSTPNRTFTVQAFSSPSPDPSGFGEGKTFAGELTNVITDLNGNASFSIRVARSKAPVGSFVTATATDNSTGDTSEFSQVCPVGSSAC